LQCVVIYAILASTIASCGSGASRSARPDPAIGFNQPRALVIASDGSLLVANNGTNQILRRASESALTILAGSGRVGFSGDGSPATKAALDDPGGLAVAPNGTVYIADTGNNRIRAVSSSGTITTAAGNGRAGLSGAGGPATRGDIGDPEAVAVGASERVYIADQAGIQSISSGGSLVTLIHGGPGAVATILDRHTALQADAVAVDREGDIYYPGLQMGYAA
jgi:serine/threonine-protein kinase